MSNTNATFSSPVADVELDARGQACPIPILLARLESKTMDEGQILLVHSTDAASKRDFKTFSAQTGHELFHEEESAEGYRFWLRIC